MNCKQAPQRLELAMESRREHKELVFSREPAPSATNTQRPVAFSVVRHGTENADTR